MAEALTRDAAAVAATKRKQDATFASGDPATAKRARMTQMDPQQLGAEEEKAEQAVKV